VRAQFIRGLNHYSLREFPAAAEAFSALPPTYSVLVNLGACLSSKGDGAGALSAWKRASELDPLGSDAVFNIGYWNFAKGDWNGAIASLERFVKLEGRDGEALFLLGRAYERVGRMEESKRLINQATRLSPRVERWLTRPVPNLQRLTAEPSLTELRPANGILWNEQRLARRASGQDLGAWLDAVQTLLDSQLFGEAVRQLQEMKQAFPLSVDTRLLLAQVYRDQKEYDLALQAVQQALALEPAHVEALALKNEIERSATGSARRRP
jgi:tetratricopeptide (TPR) repeat protein